MSGAETFHALAIVLVIAGLTMLTRFAPFLLFGKSGRAPRMVTYLGAVMPAAVILMLIVYCLRNAAWSAFPFGLPELIACAVTAGLHWFWRNTLLSIAGGTILYMFLVQTVFV